MCIGTDIRPHNNLISFVGLTEEFRLDWRSVELRSRTINQADLAGSDLTDVWEFETFRFEPRNGRLLNAGQAVHAEPKALSVLEVLLRNAGSLVEREALLDAVWGRVVVTPGTLTRLIAELRRTLKDDTAQSRFIATVHTRGYRWAGPVRRPSMQTRRSTLPQPLGILIGRNHDLADLDQLLSVHRLVTLAGPAGAGKTQLALEAARRRESRGGARTMWVDLSACSDHLSVLRQVALALDVREREQTGIEATLPVAIGDQELVVLLDNCEHVVGEIARLAATLLATCPKLTIVSTSRVILDLADEKVFWVGALSLPSYTAIKTADANRAVRESDAVRLFLERARAIAPGFELQPVTVPVVAEICRRLDGLPLALELAAARLAILTPEQLLDGLDDRFALLARQASYADPRHRSLRAAIEWSYALLEPRERSLLDALGVFRGSWPLDAAQAVAADNALARIDAINLVQSLVQKSLIGVERDGQEIRYRLLDTVAAFSLTQLRADGREVATRSRHAQYYIDLAQEADRALLSSQQVGWLERIRREWPNISGAWEFLHGDPDHAGGAVELASRLRWYFWIRGHYGESMQWCRAALILPTAADDEAHVRLLNGSAIVSFHHTQYDLAVDWASKAMALADRKALRFEAAFAAVVRCLATSVRGEPEAQQWADCEARLGQVQDAWIHGFAMVARAYPHIIAERHQEALTLLEPAISRLEMSGDTHWTAFATVQWALQKSFVGEHVQAAGAYRRALQLARDIGNLRMTTGCCEGSSHIAARRGDYRFAAQLMGAASAGRDTSGAPQARQWMTVHAVIWSEVVGALGEAIADESFSSGRRQGLEEMEPQLDAYLERFSAASETRPPDHSGPKVPPALPDSPRKTSRSARARS